MLPDAQDPFLSRRLRLRLLLLGRIAVHQLVEVALMAVCRVILINKTQTAFIELFKEFIPGDLVKFVVVCVRFAGKLYAQQANIILAASSLDAGWFSTPFFRPSSNFFVIRGCMRKVLVSTFFFVLVHAEGAACYFPLRRCSRSVATQV